MKRIHGVAQYTPSVSSDPCHMPLCLPARYDRSCSDVVVNSIVPNSGDYSLEQTKFYSTGERLALSGGPVSGELPPRNRQRTGGSLMIFDTRCGAYLLAEFGSGTPLCNAMAEHIPKNTFLFQLDYLR
jgi:hypothetical protein